MLNPKDDIFSAGIWGNPRRSSKMVDFYLLGASCERLPFVTKLNSNTDPADKPIAGTWNLFPWSEFGGKSDQAPGD